MKNVLVTGGSGFVGRHLIAKLLSKYPDIVVTSLSRSEGVISKLLTDCPSERLKISMADIRDIQSLEVALRDVDTVLHLAAMKRVDLSEELCREAVTTNVIGTMNILDVFHGETFIHMSTDKAVEPVNCYGATKLVAEKLVMEKANNVEDSKNRFMIIRSGNIIGSTGSVFDIWKRQMEEHNEITVTHPDMMRYYTDVENVVNLFLAVLERGENNKIYFTPSGNPVILKDVIQQAIKLYGNERTTVRVIGLRPGERMYERMYGTDEKNVVSGFHEVLAER